ncbi:Arc family DNA-binding protein [Variovorax sp. LjRoot290]|uniref:FitA-like ribbon-helix-helix domain-containing protein n=1 Tax=unclassified Variovorax TaxID=663243 RepID=UPI003ECE8F6C
MANLSIKGVPDDIAERLRQRAARNHRSLQGELMAIIEQAAGEPKPVPSHAFQRASKSIEQIAAEHRARFPQPIAHGPDAVDIIRTERDVR